MSLESIRFFLTFIFLSLLMGVLTVAAWKKLMIIYQRPGNFKNLVKGFKAKMWMTWGLGSVFFGLYFLVVYAGKLYLQKEITQFLFILVHQSPLYFIYLGLFIFICFSLAIYLVRMVIKYLFLTRGKGD